MRVEKFITPRPYPDPKTLSGANTIFDACYEGGVQRDIYMVAGVFYVVRDGCVGVYTTHGTGFVRGESGARLAEELLKKFPRPEPKPVERGATNQA